MMDIRNEIVIDAPAETIYALASATERWPQILPHYRSVRILQRDGDRRVVEMAARRGWIPVRWRAEQLNDSETPSITFRHISGWTAGMNVRWYFVSQGASTRVGIDHRLRFRFPVAAELIGKHIVGTFFIEAIAARTLRCMKMLAESSA